MKKLHLKEISAVKQAEMLQAAQQVIQSAYAPYSKYKVGACVMTDDGFLFEGCNVENASYGLTICAEVAAICTMIANGKNRIDAILIMSNKNECVIPCGRCRQFIREFADPTTVIFLCNNTGKICKTFSVAEILPLSFEPDYLTFLLDGRKTGE